MKYFTIIFASLLSLTSLADSKQVETETTTAAVEKLPVDLRQLLSQEMKALETGMQTIISAYYAGNWPKIEAVAGKMKNSYILKQRLSQQQKHILHARLPHSFIQQDRHFHYLAGMLEHAAQVRKPELVNFYFSEMNRQCFSCHADFATHKFPALKNNRDDLQTH